MQAHRRSQLRVCARNGCGGNAYLDLLDEPQWRCLQCARPVASTEATTKKDGGIGRSDAWRIGL